MVFIMKIAVLYNNNQYNYINPFINTMIYYGLEDIHTTLLIYLMMTFIIYEMNIIGSHSQT